MPAILLAHAGGFHTFDKSDLRGTGRWLADHGVAAIAVDYSLAAPGRPTWRTAPQDLLSALRWAQNHAGKYGIDTSRISMGGMSAGGTLAMTTAYRLQNGTIRAAKGPTPKPPASVVGFYPAADVTQMWKTDVSLPRGRRTLHRRHPRPIPPALPRGLPDHRRPQGTATHPARRRRPRP